MKTREEIAECSALMEALSRPPTASPHQTPPRRNASHPKESTPQALAMSSSAAYSETSPLAGHAAGCLSRGQCVSRVAAEGLTSLAAALSTLAKAALRQMFWVLHLWRRGLVPTAQKRHPTTSSASAAHATSHCRHQPEETPCPPESRLTLHRAASEDGCNRPRS